MTGPTPDAITVNGHRLWQSLMGLAEIGAYDDERTGLRGVNRLALTDAAGRRQVIGWMEQAGLTVRIDRMGNIYGRREGTDPTAAPVLTGSHIDSVATAGAPPYAYVECHIEQGPVLAENDVQIGVVTGVQGISWQEITIHGRAAHAGTTPTRLRADAASPPPGSASICGPWSTPAPTASCAPPSATWPSTRT
ncbi:hypothetical protein ACFQ10_03625 [Streptomyces indonesiensis]